MTRPCWIALLACGLIFQAAACHAAEAQLRPPAVPLVTVDPYMSCWSMGDTLAGEWPQHWTGRVHAMCGFVRVDGKAWRFMGDAPQVKENAKQTSLSVRATQTVYEFLAGGVKLSVTFTAPLLMDDLDLLSRPVNYVTFAAATADGKPHDVADLLRRHRRVVRQRRAADGRLEPLEASMVWT